MLSLNCKLQVWPYQKFSWACYSYHSDIQKGKYVLITLQSFLDRKAGPKALL